MSCLRCSTAPASHFRYGLARRRPRPSDRFQLPAANRSYFLSPTFSSNICFFILYFVVLLPFPCSLTVYFLFFCVPIQELVKHTHDPADKSNLRKALDAMKVWPNPRDFPVSGRVFAKKREEFWELWREKSLIVGVGNTWLVCVCCVKVDLCGRKTWSFVRNTWLVVCKRWFVCVCV